MPGPARESFLHGAALRRLALWGARDLPLPWLRWSPGPFGVLFAAALPRQRACVRRNLRRVRGPQPAWGERVAVARTFAAYAHCLAEALAVERPEAAHARRRVTGEGGLAALRQGGFLLTAHAGPWDAASALLARDLDVPVTVVMQAEPSERARRLQDAVRARSGVEVAHVGSGPLDGLGLVRRAREGRVVALQLDRVPASGRTLEVSLFGQPFAVPEGPFRLAMAAARPLVTVFVRRRGLFDYEFVVGEPHALAPRSSREELLAVARAVTAEFERFIAADPTQWFDFA